MPIGNRKRFLASCIKILVITPECSSWDRWIKEPVLSSSRRET